MAYRVNRYDDIEASTVWPTIDRASWRILWLACLREAWKPVKARHGRATVIGPC